MNSFFMNGILWYILNVPPDSSLLIDRTGNRRVATTDPEARTIYISWNLERSFRKRVLIHELAHASMVSYGLISQVHSFSYPDENIAAEEWICNFLADYGSEIFQIAMSMEG